MRVDFDGGSVEIRVVDEMAAAARGGGAVQTVELIRRVVADYFATAKVLIENAILYSVVTGDFGPLNAAVDALDKIAIASETVASSQERPMPN